LGKKKSIKKTCKKKTKTKAKKKKTKPTCCYSEKPDFGLKTCKKNQKKKSKSKIKKKTAATVKNLLVLEFLLIIPFR